jgi:hypothetical protein
MHLVEAAAMEIQLVVQMVEEMQMQMPLGEGSVVELRDDARRRQNLHLPHHPSLC